MTSSQQLLARAAVVLVMLTVGHGMVAAAQAPMPANWPNVVQFGMADAPGGGPVLAQAVPGGFRYTYFSGGVNTNAGWSTYNSPAGAYATIFFNESISNGLIPVGIYYQLLQSTPHSGSGESAEDLSNFNNLATMQAWFADFTLLLQKAGACAPNLVVLNIEPDFWGYVEQAATAAGGTANVTGQVGACGGAVAGYANNVIGFAQAILHLRDVYAPNVAIGINASIWGTGWDLLQSVPKPDDAKATAMGVQSGQFINSLQTHFDLLFGEFLDADSGYDQIIRGNDALWFQSVDYRHLREFFANLSVTADKRIVIWQSPIGNTLMQSCNNSWGHYQSNQAEWLLDDLSTTNIADFVNSGVIAFLFGGGQSGDTSASDTMADGVTNPGPIAFNSYSSNPNPNVIQAVLGAAGSPPVYNASAQTLTTPNAADDDGGYLRWKLYDYYQAGPVTLSTGAGSASQIAFVIQPTTSVAGVAMAPAVQVAIEDSTGATVTTATGSVTLAVTTGTGSLQGVMTVAVVNGVATFTDVFIDQTGSGYQLSATAGVFTHTSASFSITAPPAPIITSFSPPADGVGASITINGSNLVGVTAVQFNGSSAPFIATASSTQLTATVPVSATSGVITIIAIGGTGVSSASFTVIPPPVITSFIPGSGGSGTLVTISGVYFASTTSVSFSGTASTFTINGAGTQLTATVPAGATNGPITVTTLGGTAVSTTYTTGLSATAPSTSSSSKCGSGLFASLGLLFFALAFRRRFS